MVMLDLPTRRRAKDPVAFTLAVGALVQASLGDRRVPAAVLSIARPYVPNHARPLPPAFFRVLRRVHDIEGTFPRRGGPA